MRCGQCAHARRAVHTRSAPGLRDVQAKLYGNYTGTIRDLYGILYGNYTGTYILREISNFRYLKKKINIFCFSRENHETL